MAEEKATTKKRRKEHRPESVKAMEEQYNLIFGGIPSDPESLERYVLEQYPFQQKLLDRAMTYVDSVEWREITYELMLLPTTTPRPRVQMVGNFPHFYVAGAAATKKYMAKYIAEHIIYTRTHVFIDAYIPPPVTQMNNAEIYLAEKKLIVPLAGGDVDNFMKTYFDAITGLLLINDNIVTTGRLSKWYSVKPRIEIRIQYQAGFDSRFNERRMFRSKQYRDYRETHPEE